MQQESDPVVPSCKHRTQIAMWAELLLLSSVSSFVPGMRDSCSNAAMMKINNFWWELRRDLWDSEETRMCVSPNPPCHSCNNGWLPICLHMHFSFLSPACSQPHESLSHTLSLIFIYFSQWQFACLFSRVRLVTCLFSNYMAASVH